MRQKAKLVLFAALSAALTVAGLSLAAGGSSSGSDANGKDREFGLRLHRDGGPPGVAFDRDVADVMRQIHQAVEQKAPEIADPVIQKAQDAGDITNDQADKLRAAAQAIADGKRPDLDRSLLRDADVRKVVRDALDAARKQAAELGEPIIQKALDEKKITSDQADQIRERLKNPPPFGPGLEIGPGFGHGPGFGPGGPPPGFRNLDKDVAAVLDDIHDAVEAKESEVAEPIIKKAVDDGKITEAQADALRNHRPAGFDKDVFAVLRDIHQAVAKQVPGIADPIVDKAVAEKKITSAQAANIREKLKDPPTLRFRGGPPPVGGPHGNGWGRKGRSQQGIAPGAFPGGAAPGAVEPAVVPGQPA